MVDVIIQKLTVLALVVFALGAFRVSGRGSGGTATADAAKPAVRTGLELAVRFDKKTAAGQPLNATVTLTNNGPDRETVNARLLLNDATAPDAVRDLSFDVAGPPGFENLIRFAIRAGAPKDGDFVTLAPGQSISRRYELTRYFGLQTPGECHLRATYLDARTGKQVQSDDTILARR